MSTIWEGAPLHVLDSNASAESGTQVAASSLRRSKRDEREGRSRLGTLGAGGRCRFVNNLSEKSRLRRPGSGLISSCRVSGLAVPFSSENRESPRRGGVRCTPYRLRRFRLFFFGGWGRCGGRSGFFFPALRFCFLAFASRALRWGNLGPPYLNRETVTGRVDTAAAQAWHPGQSSRV